MIRIRYTRMLEALRRIRVDKHRERDGWILNTVRPRIKELTRRAVSKKSGIAEKTLTQIARDPFKDLSFATVNKLVNFFYREFQVTPPYEFLMKPPYTQIDGNLFEWVVTNLIEILPDVKEDQEFWDTLSLSNKSWINKDKKGSICPDDPMLLNDGTKIPFKTDLLKEHERLQKEKKAKRTSKP